VELYNVEVEFGRPICSSDLRTLLEKHTEVFSVSACVIHPDTPSEYLRGGDSVIRTKLSPGLEFTVQNQPGSN